jgi:[ribosomal protein S18]-alanine N-acetyltransferase
MPTVIRSATLSDVPSILFVEQRSQSVAHWTTGQYSQLVQNGVVLVAAEGGEHAADLIGFVCAQRVAGEWEIENVVVDARFRRQGVAGQLLQALIRRARSESVTALLLEVRESNLPARSLYEKNQFHEVGRRRSYYKHPAEDAILYALKFES